MKRARIQLYMRTLCFFFFVISSLFLCFVRFSFRRELLKLCASFDEKIFYWYWKYGELLSGGYIKILIVNSTRKNLQNLQKRFFLK